MTDSRHDPIEAMEPLPTLEATGESGGTASGIPDAHSESPLGSAHAVLRPIRRKRIGTQRVPLRDDGSSSEPEIAAAEAHFGRDYYGRDRFEKYLAYFRGERPILDFGCGEGVFLHLLRRHGRRGLGIDYDRSNVELARSFGLDVEYANILEFVTRPEERGRYDGIMMGDFVEHFDPVPLQALLRHAVALLAEGGTLVIVTPNSRSLLMNTGGFYEATIEHHNPYSIAGLARFLDEEGMDFVAGGVDPDSRSQLWAFRPTQLLRNLALWGLGRILCGRDAFYECSYLVTRKRTAGSSP